MEIADSEIIATIGAQDIKRIHAIVCASVEHFIPISLWKIKPKGIVVIPTGESLASVSATGEIQIDDAFLGSDAYILLEMILRKQFALMAVGKSFRGSCYLKIIERAFGYEDSADLVRQREHIRSRIEHRKRISKVNKKVSVGEQASKGRPVIC